MAVDQSEGIARVIVHAGFEPCETVRIGQKVICIFSPLSWNSDSPRSSPVPHNFKKILHSAEMLIVVH